MMEWQISPERDVLLNQLIWHLIKMLFKEEQFLFVIWIKEIPRQKNYIQAKIIISYCQNKSSCGLILRFLFYIDINFYEAFFIDECEVVEKEDSKIYFLVIENAIKLEPSILICECWVWNIEIYA